MHFICRSFIGRPTKNSWSQYWENEPDDPAIVVSRGHIFGLINFDVTEDTDISSLGHELIAEINQYYFSSIDSEDALIRLKSVLTGFVAELDFQFSNLSLILAVVLGEQLHIAILNRGRCILHRGLTISPLLTGTNGQVVSISGALADNDRFLLCTEDFFTKITWENIKNSLVLPQIQDMEETFIANLYRQPDQHGLAGVFIKVNTDILNIENESAQTTDTNSSNIPDMPREQPLVKEKISFIKKIFSRRPVYVSHHENIFLSRRKKINIIFSLVILLALAVSIIFGAHQNQTKQIEKKYQDLKTQAETKLNNAKTIQKINLSGALVTGKEALALVNDMANLKIHPTEVNQLRSQISTLLSQSGSAADYNPEMFFDTSIISNNLNYTQIVLVKDSLYLLDSSNGRIDIFDLSRKSTTSVSQSDTLKGSTSIAVNNDKVYLLNNKQIYQADRNNLLPQIDLAKQIENFDAGQIQFWNGSLYLLTLPSQSDATIWKFSPSAGGFVSGQVWLKDKQSLPVDSTSFAINGKVWVLSKNGTIAPFSLGTREDFKMSASDNLENASNIVTSPDAELLAFTSSQNLVHIYQKDGQSPKLFNLGNRQISSLAIDSSGKSVYVLCQDQKIYKIAL